MFCPNCGSEVAEGKKFCGKCGGKVRAAAGNMDSMQDVPQIPVPPTVPVPVPKGPASPLRKLTYALVVLLAILGGVAWWWFHRPPPAYQVQDPGIYPFSSLSADGKTQDWGFIDADGKVAIQPEWSAVAFSNVLGQEVAFSEGLCGVMKDGKWGYIDTGGHLTIPAQFDSAGPFVDGLARVQLGKQYGFIDKTGHYAVNPELDLAGDFHEGLAAVQSEGKWGFVDHAGSFVIKPRFSAASVSGFSNGLAAVCADSKCGYIDSSGTFAILPRFTSVNDFSQGLASVQIDGKWGYIDTGGRIVINPQFDQTTTFSSGLAAVSSSGHQGTIDRQGKYVLNPGQFNLVLMTSNLQTATGNDGEGLLSRDGKWVVKPSKALTGTLYIIGKVFYGTIAGQAMVPISLSGKVLAGPYKEAMLDSLAQDIDNENKAQMSMNSLVGAETSYSNAYPDKGFTPVLSRLGPATGTSDASHAGFIDADLATGTKDGYSFSVTIPPGTSTGGTNFNFFVVAKPQAGHFGRSFCADSSGYSYSADPGQDCTPKSHVVLEPDEEEAPGSAPQTRNANPAASNNQNVTAVPGAIVVRKPGTADVLCYLNNTGSIRILDAGGLGGEGDWFKTDACGPVGYIHRSHIKF